MVTTLTFQHRFHYDLEQIGMWHNVMRVKATGSRAAGKNLPALYMGTLPVPGRVGLKPDLQGGEKPPGN